MERNQPILTLINNNIVVEISFISVIAKYVYMQK
jgi:hypothetical protein